MILTNEWSYEYDTLGNLSKATNIYDFIKGVSHGTDSFARQHNALPYIGGPWELTKNYFESEWSYKYDSAGKTVEQSGFVFREFVPAHGPNIYQIYSGTLKWKIIFSYDKSGLLTREEEYYPFDAEKPVFIRELQYDKNKNLKR
ncbi:MAG: hypothetical protein KKA07_11645, partial [Bacteroidetes bacterium]|nr:hypothetical protein [Bacteroidota bacterium]